MKGKEEKAIEKLNQLYLAILAGVNKAAVINVELGGQYSIDELLAIIKILNGRIKINWEQQDES